MPPPPDWLSWEFLGEAAATGLRGPRDLVTWIWGGYVANRDNLVPLATFLGAVTIAWAALRQAKTATLRHAEQTSADRERRITESFAKAGEQLGSNKLETRLVGIYTLERIARESEREYWPIMETFTAYVREHAPWPPRQAVANPVELQSSSAGETAGDSTPAEQPANEAEPASIQIRPVTDIRAVLSVLGRREEAVRQKDHAEERSLDLTRTDLRGAYLRRAHLESVKLHDAHLEDASLWEAHLEAATLRRAHLERANLREAHLTEADLQEAHLEAALLRDAHLEGADLRGAHLEGAVLWGAHLEGADLCGAHLEGALLGGEHLEGALLERAHLEGAFLGGEHLEGAFLGGEHLEGADLWGAHLEGAELWAAHLEGADLWGAHLEGAELWAAHLEGADLRGAHLEGASLRGAHLEGANLQGASLVRARLEGADLGDVVGLMQFQLDAASGDAHTVLPQGLTRPTRWSPAVPEEPRNPE